MIFSNIIFEFELKFAGDFILTTLSFRTIRMVIIVRFVLQTSLVMQLIERTAKNVPAPDVVRRNVTMKLVSVSVSKMFRVNIVANARRIIGDSKAAMAVSLVIVESVQIQPNVICWQVTVHVKVSVILQSLNSEQSIYPIMYRMKAYV